MRKKKTTTTMKKHKITSLKALRKQKAALSLQIEQEQAELVAVAENLVWPLGAFRRFRKAADNVADNRFFVLGAQLAQSILNTAWKRKKENETHEEKHTVVEFIKQVADEFLNTYHKREQ